jgi:ATP-binding cassette subfamily C protein CydCD
VLDQDAAALASGAGASPGPGAVAQPHRPAPGPGTDRTVTLDHLGVAYPGRDLPALHDVTLELGHRQLVALTGPSGAGKTTLLAVLLGQVDATSGSLTRARGPGPVPAATAAWRSDLAWMPQRPRPTQDTVAEEVRLGDPELTDDSLLAVLEACAAPPGMTPLGEDGGMISAGQRRRVALARALVRTRRVLAAGRTPVVLLDEPTEDLDDATAAIVRRVMTEMAQVAVVVAATHDAVLISRADREVRLVDGRLTADATRIAEDRATTARPTTLTAATLPPAALTPTGVANHSVGTGAGVVPPAPPQLAPTPPTAGRVLRVRAALVAAGGARRSLVLAGIFGILGGMSGLALTATSVWLICRAAQHPNIQALAIAVVGVRAFALGRALLRYAERLSAHDGALRLLAEVRARVFAALIPLAPAGLFEFRRGDLLRRFTSDVDGAQEALIRAVVPLAGVAGTGVAATLLAALIDPTAGWLLAAGLLAGGVVVPALTARVVTVGDGSLAAGRRDALVGGLLDGLGELEAYGGVDDHLERITGADAASVRDGVTAGRAGAAGVTATGVVTALTVTAMVAAGARAVASGSTSGILLGVLAVTGLVAFEAAGSLPSAYAALGRCQTSMRRIDAVLTTPAPYPDPEHAAALRSHTTGVAVSHVTLRPATTAPVVLVDASLDLGSGGRVALVGPSGSGKTTVLAAVLRLLPTEAGRIALHDAAGPDVPLRHLCADQIPPLVAGSLQGDHVFSTTLRDNLRFVAPDATDADLDVVATRVGLTDWVRALPDGWSTQTGADGANLSGGQRQRLLVARGLLADPAILVLDEPTAHLDAVTEAAVMADLMGATGGRTLLVSTHRSHLLGGFDHVLALEDRHLEEDTSRQPETVSR